jgi:hypothetical protein
MCYPWAFSWNASGPLRTSKDTKVPLLNPALPTAAFSISAFSFSLSFQHLSVSAFSFTLSVPC